MSSYYKIENFKDFLAQLMDNDIVCAVIIPMKSLSEDNYSPFLIKDRELLANCEPVSPVMTINSAKSVSALTIKGALNFKTAVVLKPCELRAFRELIKLNQINNDNIITISFNCNGINNLKDREIKREICEICTDFTPDFADIKLYFQKNGHCIVDTDIDITGLKLETSDFDKEKWVENIVKEKERAIQKREEKLSEIKGNFKDLLKNCISCHNCMRVCPICFCQECFFDSPAVKGNVTTYLMRANRLTGLDFPENKLLFQLGRMNHMSVSCVSCGACEDACPAEIPVSQMFAAAGDELKKLFNYEPGKNLEDKVPFTCFEHDELHSFEEQYVKKL